MKRKIMRFFDYVRSYGLNALALAILRRILSALQKKLLALETRLGATLNKLSEKLSEKVAPPHETVMR